MAFSRLLPRPHARPKDAKGATTARVIALANQKGGVAKTTTTLNLAVALKEKGKRVLIIDLDPQGNLTMSQGMNPDAIERSMFDVLVRVRVHPLTHRQVPLRIEIDHEHAEALFLEGDREVQRRRRFRDAALLVREDDHPLQARLLRGWMCPRVRTR